MGDRIISISIVLAVFILWLELCLYLPEIIHGQEQPCYNEKSNAPVKISPSQRLIVGTMDTCQDEKNRTDTTCKPNYGSIYVHKGEFLFIVCGSLFLGTLGCRAFTRQKKPIKLLQALYNIEFDIYSFLIFRLGT